MRELSLRIEPGELLVLLGPSGCGKTTTLRLIAGLDAATGGDVQFDGVSQQDVPPAARNVALVFQQPTLVPHLSVYRNLTFSLRMRGGGGSGTSLDRRVRELAHGLGVESLLDRLPAELSVGQQQRVAIGRALVRAPSLYLWDEPLASLDPVAREGLRRDLRRWHDERGSTEIYVTHDQREALALGDRIAVLDAGQLQQVGSAEEVYGRPANTFVAGFLGSPPMNLLRGELRRTGEIVEFRSPECRLPVDRGLADALQHYVERPVILGLRPEHLRLGPRITAASDEESDPPRDASIAGVVERLESLGESDVVHVRPSGGAARVLLVRTEAGAFRGGAPRVGVGSAAGVASPGEVSVVFGWRHAHWFDGQSGQRIAVEGRGPRSL